MNPYYPHLFEPLTIKGVTFRNRLFVAPHMMSHMDFNGRPDESMIDFYAEKGLLKNVDGSKPLAEVTEAILAALGSN